MASHSHCFLILRKLFSAMYVRSSNQLAPTGWSTHRSDLQSESLKGWRSMNKQFSPNFFLIGKVTHWVSECSLTQTRTHFRPQHRTFLLPLDSALNWLNSWSVHLVLKFYIKHFSIELFTIKEGHHGDTSIALTQTPRDLLSWSFEVNELPCIYPCVMILFLIKSGIISLNYPMRSFSCILIMAFEMSHYSLPCLANRRISPLACPLPLSMKPI